MNEITINTGKTSHDYYLTVKGGEKGISVEEYLMQELGKLGNELAQYRIDHRNADKAFWQKYDRCRGLMQQFCTSNEADTERALKIFLRCFTEMKRGRQNGMRDFPHTEICSIIMRNSDGTIKNLV